MTDLAAKREARRRKILENSQSRLNKILGVPSTGSENAHNIEYDTLHEPSIFDTEIASSELGYDLNLESDISDIPQNSIKKDAPLQSISKLQQLLSSKLHLLFTSILVYVLSFELQYFSYSIFLPFMLCEVTDFFLNKEVEEKPSLLYLLLLNKLSKNKINTITTILNISSKVFNDISIYIFTFVMMHLLMPYLVDISE